MSHSLVTVEEMQSLVHKAEFFAQYRVKVESVGDGTVTVRVPFNEKYVRPGGNVPGPVYMAVADFSMWLAIMTKLGIKQESLLSLTSELTTAFLGGARQQDFLCTATILKMGRRLIYGTCECRTDDGKLVTHHTVTYVRPTS
jgi:uncharacterized protein (TIGR00369 family)